ncbi:MAG TPA: S8 family serine peptidase, partial [Candidatus Binatus sp.]|nr:S8 family serine peptidase [Candidatus Binatus sp.]
MHQPNTAIRFIVTLLLAGATLVAFGCAGGGGGGTTGGGPAIQAPTPTPTPKPVSCLLAHLMHATAAWVAPRPSKPAAITTKIGPGPARRVCGYAGPGQMRCMAWKRTDLALSPPVNPPGYGPADLQAAYNLPSQANGTFQTVAIVDAFDDPNAESDLAFYRTTFSLPPCTTANGCFLKVNQDGATSPLPSTDPSPCSSPQGCWEEEEALDLDMVSAVCPNCHIVLVEANGQNGAGDLYVAENSAAQKCAATEISNSWNGAEYPGEQNDDVNFNHPGVPITFASGDSGYPGGYPTASTLVTAVGGTTLSNAGKATQTETAWLDSGALCSRYIAQPSWQSNVPTVVNNPGVCTMRINNDVSAVGDPNTGVAVYTTFGGDPGWLVFGGTSVSTPIIAAVYALAGNGASIHDGSYSYSHTSSLTDIFAGSITPCPSGSPNYTGTYV